MKTTKGFPFYCVFFASYPALALMSNNITENKLIVVVRPLLVSIVIAMISLLIIWFISRDIQRSGLITLLFCALFFSFGHIFGLLEGKSILGYEVDRIRYLALLFLVVFIIGSMIILRTKHIPAGLSRNLLIISLVLLVIPVGNIILHSISSKHYSKISEQSLPVDQSQAIAPMDSPDIYYIILDSYTRQDVLEQAYHYDNQPFIDTLKNIGFYIADCSQSNYLRTHYSLASSLNMDYLPNLDDRLQPGKVNPDVLMNLIKHSKVRADLKQLGYRFIAFENTYINTQIPDADVYIRTSNISIAQILVGYINPFEEMFIKTTTAVVVYRIPLGAFGEWIMRSSFPYYEDANIQLNQLRMLPEIAEEPGPKFVFVHMNIPHRPFIFDENGELLTDPEYYGDNGKALSRRYHMKGYTKQIAFLNNQLPTIISNILTESMVKSIIIIQGDHGLDPQNRSKILNAIYFPDQNYNTLYPSISPVNTFRLVFNQYFGTTYPILKDQVNDVYPPSIFSVRPIVVSELCK